MITAMYGQYDVVYDRNLDQVSVSEPKFLLPKLPPYSFLQIFLMLFVPYYEYFLGYTQLS